MNEAINTIIKENQISIRKFCEMINVSRAYIQQVMKGEKPLSQATLDKILEIDTIAAEHKALLKKAYFMQQYQSVDTDLIEYFLNHIQTFNDKCREEADVYIRKNTLENRIFNSDSPYCLSGRSEIVEVCMFFFEKALEGEGSFLYTNFPTDFKELEDALFTSSKHRDYNKKLDFCKTANVSAVCSKKFFDDIFSILKWSSAQLCVSFRFGQDSYPGILMPYYVITNNAVIVFDEDCACGVAYTDIPTINYYCKSFKKAKKNFPLSNVIFENELELMSFLRENTTLKYCLDCCGSFGAWLDYDVLDSAAHADLPQREYLIQAVLNHYSVMDKDNVSHIIQSKTTHKAFLESGEFKQITHRFLDTIPVNMRVRIFENMLKSVEEEKVNLELLNENKFTSPDNFFVEAYNNSIGFELLYSEEENKGTDKLYSANLYISYDDVSGLSDFFKSLEIYLVSCDYTVPKENVKKIISDLITRGKYLIDKD